jgi:hypothetical protein
MVSADGGYTGVHKLDEVVRAQQDGTIRADITWNLARHGKGSAPPTHSRYRPGRMRAATARRS